jgi:hypothetical protein
VLGHDQESRAQFDGDQPTIEMVIKGAIASKYRNVGQTCVRANRPPPTGREFVL